MLRLFSNVVPRGPVLGTVVARGLSSGPAQQLISADPDRKHLIFNEAAAQGWGSEPITTIVGPSRQGKSHLANLCVGRNDAFPVSQSPLEACTFGAWAARGRRGIVLDTEGLSHQTTVSTKKLFFAMYPISSNIVFSSKEVGADSFMNIIQELSELMLDYKSSSEQRKPRLFVVLRDAESFQFSKDGARYTSVGQSFDEMIQAQLAPSLRKHALFSTIKGIAIPSVRDITQSDDFSSVGDLQELLSCIGQTHEGPLLSISDTEAIRSMFDSINEKGHFDMATLLGKLIPTMQAKLGVFQAALGSDEDKQVLAERFEWASGDLLAGFETARSSIDESIHNLTKSFPSASLAAQPLRDSIDGLDHGVSALASRIDRKTAVYETREVEEIQYEERVEPVSTLTGTLGGAAAGARLAAAADVVTLTVLGSTTVLTGGAALAAGGIAGAVVGGTLGAVAGAEKVPVVKKVLKEVHVGWRLGS